MSAGRASERKQHDEEAGSSSVDNHGVGDCAVRRRTCGERRHLRGAHGRHVGVGGCTNIVGDVATGVAIASATDPYVPGEIPCYTVEGVPYYTPPGDPC